MKLPVLLQLVLLQECICMLSRLGRLCSSDAECKSRSGGEVCGEEGYCVCRDAEALRYDSLKLLMPKCDAGGSFSSKCGGDQQTCPKNAFCNTNNTCVCLDGHVFFMDECIPGKSSKALELCRKDDALLFFCDFHDGLVCRGGKCHCFPDFYLNYTNRKCERQSDYLEAHNMTEYRVKPGLYCRKGADCIEGLVCKDFKCACPQQCEYDEEVEVCDCGSSVSLAGPIIVGGILGLLIIGFWLVVNYITYLKITDMRDLSRSLDAVGPTYNVSYSNPASLRTDEPPTGPATSKVNLPPAVH